MVEFAFPFAMFLLGAVLGVLIGAAWCSDIRRDPVEMDGWPQ